MTAREGKLIGQMTQTSWKFYVWVGFLLTVILVATAAYFIQLRKGLIVTGLRDEVSWGIYISTFVFWVGVSKGGTMISGILRVTQTGWRTPVTRMAEVITVLALITGAPMIVADLGRPERMWELLRYGRIQSPLIWDFISVLTYLTACVIYFYLPLIPDVALLAQDFRLPLWRRKLYQKMSVCWIDSPEQRQLLERAIHAMAIIVIPLAVSVHTVVSWIFAMTLRPGWNSTIYGPYFVVGAIYSGAASVILSMWALRRVFHLEDYVQPEHFRKLGKLLLVATLVYLYFNINEYLTIGYKLEGFERDLVETLFIGRFAKMFWSVQILGVLVPIAILMLVLLIKPLHRFSIAAVGSASLLIVVGAWAKRFLIVVPTLETPFLPAQRIPATWTGYSPTWIEWAIIAGGLAFFLLAYTLVTKLFPIVSIWETRGEPASVPAPERAVGQAFIRPAASTAIGAVLLLVIIGQAYASSAPKKAPAPSALTLTYELVPPAQEVAASQRELRPGVRGTLENPFITQRRAAEEPLPTIALTAKLLDDKSAPVQFKPISFSMKATFGSLALGIRPTGGDGVAHLKLTSRRFGTYTIQASFAGDDQAAASNASAEVQAASLPPASLPKEGMLITPYPTFWITVPFALFFGTMWVIFGYVVYTVFWRIRRLGSKHLDIEGRVV